MVGALVASADGVSCGASIKTERDCASGWRSCQPILIPAEATEIKARPTDLPRVVAVLEDLLQIAKCASITGEPKTNLLTLTIQKHHGSRVRIAVSQP